MDNITAAQKINAISFMPGWRVTATPLWEGFVHLSVEIDTVNSDREMALKGYPQKITINPDTLLTIADVWGDDDLYEKVFAFLMEVFVHEAREFFRVGEDKRAPFHPHRADGQQRWEQVLA